jgi:peroxiredoxin
MVIRTRRRLLARAVAIILAAALLAQLLHTALAADTAPAAAPDFAAKSVAGRNIRLSEYRSEVVALTFVAEWCGECERQLRELAGLRADFGGQGLAVLTVSFDQTAGLAGDVLLDPDGDIGKLYDIDDLPAVVLVDRAGALRLVHDDGKLMTGADLRPVVTRLLDE